ncbi:twin-arginine translocation signal domain-containing protein [Halomicrobium sp. LC1Hm]|uniref:twin-arginine translocation signal domain-containing protein n=1 Tax=Halomicrobium sp. LC1Hm TaxID=2610902 RepID=UPI001298341F|nr:twin-arginine translocation signal domain-containing protein [Halomicrobium sp. LC1Hm]QGA82017.1 Uncharacterized protein LC1Hm_0955 [Halomicrobium sp. LC1Hm]
MSEHNPDEFDDHDGTPDDYDEAQLYDDTQTALSRRDFLKGVGATAGAAATGGATIDTTNAATTTSSIDYGYIGDDTARTSSMMMMAAPVSSFAGTPGEVAEAGGELADFLFGDEPGADEEQLELSMYSQAQTIRSTFKMLMKQNLNNLKNAENNAIAKAKYEVAKVIRDGGSQQEAGLVAREAVFDAYAVYQRNFIKALEAALARIQHIRERQLQAEGVDSPTVWYNTDWDGYDESWSPREDSNEDLIGLSDLEIKLLDGETVQTKALLASAGNSSDYEQWIIHPYLSGSLNSHVVSDAGEPEYEGTLASLGGDPHYENYDPSQYNLYVERFDSNNPEFNPIHVKWLDDYSVEDGVNDYIADKIHSRATTLANEAQTLGEDLHAAYQADEISMNDLIDPYVRAEEMAMDWQDTGHFGYAAGFANQFGYASDLSKTMTVSWFDKSANETQELSGTLLPSPRVSKNTVEKTVEFSGWTYGSNLDVEAKLGDKAADVLANRTGHTVEYKDGSGSTASASEGSDYTDQLGKGAIEIQSGGSIPEGNTVTVTITSELLRAKTFKVGDTYTVEQDGDYLFAVQGGLKTFKSGDEFTVKNLENASGENIDSVNTDPGNVQKLNTQQILDRLERIEEAQERLNQQDPPEGSGGGSGGGVVGLPNLGDANIPLWAPGGIIAAFIAYALTDDDN